MIDDVPAALAAERAAGDRRPWCTADFFGINVSTNRATVSIDGSEKVDLPFVPGTYTNITRVFVLRDPDNTGVGPMVLGPCYADTTPRVPPPDAPAAGTPALTKDTAVIRASYTGSYRTSVGDWDRWNTERLGGRSTVWQGNAYGSGLMKGFAGYGSQVADLGAASIQRIVVSTPLVKYSGQITLQGSPSGSRPAGAPASSGATASGVGAVELPDSVCEAFRTGAVRGLVAVGSTYRATKGNAYPDGMTLTVYYTRPA